MKELKDKIVEALVSALPITVIVYILALTPLVDLSAAEIGTATYKATIVIDEKFPNVGAMKTSSVSATVQPKES